jgi:two-component system, cell cycle sensor histidine kinase and response regulator CckA
MKQVEGGPRYESFAQLTGHVAHDIVNMVMIVLTYTDQLAKKLDRADPAQDDVREIRTAAERAAGLTRELMTFARRQAPAPAVIDLHELILRFETLIRGVAGDAVSVEVSLGATLPRVFGERGDLEQTLLNLAINARDAIPAGGALTIITQDVVSGQASRPHVEVLVSDTGVGMDEATRGRVFEPFFSTKGSSAGTGLGLSIVAGVVAAMGGSIAVESAPGAGATFRILLPTVT